jgi:hypothetical protein
MHTMSSLDELLATLGEQLSAPGHSLLPVLGVMSRFGHYSLSNQLLIYIQRPTATRVLGFHGWRKAGFIVRKGEKGIAIYAPIRSPGRRRPADAATTERTNDTADATEATPIRFRVAYVFDISQVDRLAEANAAVTIPLTDAVPPTPLACLELLKTFLAAEGLALHYAPLAPGHYGSTDGKTIVCAQGLAPHIEFATLVHETTHALLHFTGERPDLTTRETEAEAVTYLLSEQLGLPDTGLSIDYIRSYRGTNDTLQGSLERIRTTVRRLAAVVICHGIAA